MDTSKNYILMCEKAVEIQKLHNPIAGDIYVCACNSCLSNKNSTVNIIEPCDVDCLNKRDLSNVELHYVAMVRMSEVGGFTAFYNERRNSFLSYIWLPRQDQLQHMVFNSLDTLSLLQCVWIYVNSAKLSPSSMEELWLRYVMARNYNKEWRVNDWWVR